MASALGIGVQSDEELKTLLRYDDMPSWKQRFVDRNRAFYLEHKEFIDDWIQKYDMER